MAQMGGYRVDIAREVFVLGAAFCFGVVAWSSHSLEALGLCFLAIGLAF